MNEQNPNLKIVEKSLELLLEDLRVFKDGGKSLYDWSIADFGKYNDIMQEIVRER